MDILAILLVLASPVLSPCTHGPNLGNHVIFWSFLGRFVSYAVVPWPFRSFGESFRSFLRSFRSFLVLASSMIYYHCKNRVMKLCSNIFWNMSFPCYFCLPCCPALNFQHVRFIGSIFVSKQGSRRTEYQFDFFAKCSSYRGFKIPGV